MPTNSIGSSFTHSCLKVPVNPCSGYPSPLFERNYDTIVTMSSHRDSSVSESRPVSGRSSNSHRKIRIRSQTCSRNSESELPLKSFMEFYESIPDYGDMNHLSDEEFYRKLQSLKEKQKLYVDSLNKVCCDENMKEDGKSEIISKESSISDPVVSSDINKGIVGVNCFDNRLKEKSDRTNQLKSQVKAPTNSNKGSGSWLQSSKNIRKKKQKFLEPSTSEESTVESLDNAQSEKKEEVNKEFASYASKRPTKEALQNSILVNRTTKKSQKQLINLIRDSASCSTKRPLSQVRASSGSLADSNWDNLSLDDYYSKSANSFSDSDSNIDLRCHVCPRQSKSVAWRVPKITVPKPFPSTLREKENQQIQSLKNQFIDSKVDSPSEERKSFRANPVPITSHIPLFDKIMNDQENRSREVKKQSKAKLNSMMKPFSFVMREEDDRRGMLSYSSPELHRIGKPIKTFKAKPVPKNLFSSQVYERMREDEYYRTLRKRIRSEELLRSSSLPPSMAAREKECLNKEKFELEETGKEKHKPCCKKKNRKIPDYKMSHEILRMELDGRRNEKITTTPSPFHFETADRKSRRSESAKRCCHSSSAKKVSPKRDRPVSAGTYVLHRDNLASVLRIQSSRERAEQEKLRRKEERRLRDEIRIREREFRKNPAWRIISGWAGVEEDLAMRACSRQEEEDRQRRLHQMQMETMMSRVYRIPTLFERQSEVRLPRKLIKEIHQKKPLKVREEKSRKRSQKHSVRVLSREDIGHSPSSCDQNKTEYDESYVSDPEDDKTCRQSIDEDIEEGTGVEDEIKDEEAEVGEEKDKSDEEKEEAGEVSHESQQEVSVEKKEHQEGDEK